MFFLDYQQMRKSRLHLAGAVATGMALCGPAAAEASLDGQGTGFITTNWGTLFPGTSTGSAFNVDAFGPGTEATVYAGLAYGYLPLESLDIYETGGFTYVKLTYIYPLGSGPYYSGPFKTWYLSPLEWNGFPIPDSYISAAYIMTDTSGNGIIYNSLG